MTTKRARFLFLIFLFIAVFGCQPLENPVLPTPTASIASARTQTPTQVRKPTYWIPSPTSTFQIQLSDYPPATDADVDVFDLDLFETSTDTITELHNNGKKVICYFNAGAWEEFRMDADDFPKDSIGRKYIGWPGERWLDISRYELFADVMSARFDLAVEKGCDAVDPDNINGFQQNTGFEISPQDQIIYNTWLSEQAHTRGLSIGLKNNPSHVADLVDFFDFAILEDCQVYDECQHYLPFTNQGKAVFQIEYTDQTKDVQKFCEYAKENGFIAVLKNRSLDAFLQSCQ